MSSSNSRNTKWASKCPCGSGDMKLFTSHTEPNPNRKFRRCPYWNARCTLEVLPSCTSATKRCREEELLLLNSLSQDPDTCMVELSEGLNQDAGNLSKHLKATFGISWKEVLCEG